MSATVSQARQLDRVHGGEQSDVSLDPQCVAADLDQEDDPDET